MRVGRVYVWETDPDSPYDGRVRCDAVPLARLDRHDGESDRLCGRHVRVRSAGVLPSSGPRNQSGPPIAIGDAAPNADGDFLFDPEHGGPRIDRISAADSDAIDRCIQAAR